MRSKKLAVFTILIIVVITLLLAACEPAAMEVYDMRAVETIGNHSYMPINKPYFANHTDEILGLVRRFELDHPELEITNWHLNHNDGYVYGIWIDHRARQ